ncbi:MAG TPA: aminoglycoside phosphotransferase family protein [Vulgatibacteraceae bacterium]|nr:aminoglycoside phosphotransferase family protein [Vulgatibacteraceae bacterium]
MTAQADNGVPEIPARLVDAIVFLRGEEEGRTWLAELPGRILDHARRWGLSLGRIADGGAMSCCVLCVTGDGTESVLKIPLSAEAGRQEARLLRLWGASDAVPAVLRDVPETGVFLMSRIVPGTTAWARSGPADSCRFGELLSRLETAEPAGPAWLQDLREVAELRMGWARDRFSEPRYADDPRYAGHTASIADAERVLAVLLETTRERHVLHADLQAKNILCGPEGRWFAIDPMGAVGDLNAEAALWAAVQDGPATVADRLGELEAHPLLDPERLRAWTYVFAVAEYRPYLPEPAHRIEAFLADTDPRELVEQLR